MKSPADYQRKVVVFLEGYVDFSTSLWEMYDIEMHSKHIEYPNVAKSW